MTGLRCVIHARVSDMMSERRLQHSSHSAARCAAQLTGTFADSISCFIVFRTQQLSMLYLISVLCKHAHLNIWWQASRALMPSCEP